MMWQERQNFVCFDRSMCSDAASEPHRIGKIKNATNAKIFPSRLAVREGRTTMIATKSALMLSSAKRRVSGEGKFKWFLRRVAARPTMTIRSNSLVAETDPYGLFLLRQFPDVSHQLLDLIVGQLALIGRHFLALAVRGRINQLSVCLLLHFLRAQVR